MNLQTYILIICVLVLWLVSSLAFIVEYHEHRKTKFRNIELQETVNHLRNLNGSILNITERIYNENKSLKLREFIRTDTNPE